MAQKSKRGAKLLKKSVPGTSGNETSPVKRSGKEQLQKLGGL